MVLAHINDVNLIIFCLFLFSSKLTNNRYDSDIFILQQSIVCQKYSLNILG